MKESNMCVFIIILIRSQNIMCKKPEVLSEKTVVVYLSIQDTRGRMKPRFVLVLFSIFHNYVIWLQPREKIA